jgi:phosphatidylinositol alpha-1,6-mannosyltransferase
LVFDLLGLARPIAALPRPARTPYAIMLHGLEVWRPLSPLNKRSITEASLRLANSKYTRDRARAFVGPVASSIEVLPLSLEVRTPDGEVDSALIERLGSGFLLMAGRMSVSERYKGHDEVLAAFPAVLQQVPQARLVVAGGGDDRARLEAAAAGAGLRDHVTFIGFVSEATLSELFTRCAAYVLPSRGEGFGLVYLEAMRAGKPCIAATGSAAEEIIVDGTTGFLVDPNDRQALSGSLVRLLTEPDLARRLGESGRALWLERFSLQRYRAGLEPYLDRLTAPGHVRP